MHVTEMWELTDNFKFPEGNSYEVVCTLIRQRASIGLSSMELWKGIMDEEAKSKLQSDGFSVREIDKDTEQIDWTEWLG